MPDPQASESHSRILLFILRPVGTFQDGASRESLLHPILMLFEVPLIPMLLWKHNCAVTQHNDCLCIYHNTNANFSPYDGNSNSGRRQ